MARPLLLIGLIAAVLAAPGCGRAPTGAAPAQLYGVAYTASGDPAAFARVQLSYSLEMVAPASRPSARERAPLDDPGGPPAERFFTIRNNPCSSGPVVLDFGLPRNGRALARIVGRGGHVRRTLADRAFPAGRFSIVWDGRDDEGLPLPSGVYVAEWTATEGDSSFEIQRNLLWQPPLPDAGPNAVCSAEGGFQVPLEQLPAGAAIEARDANGTDLGRFVIGRRVLVCAAFGAMGAERTGCGEPVDVGDRQHPVAVRVIVP